MAAPLQKPLEQRRYPRRSFEVRVGVLCVGKYSICFSKDIGEGGIAIISDHDLKQGARILLSFQIPSGHGKGDFISVIGTILSVKRHASGFLHGISFDELDFNYKRQIRAYVASKKFQ